MGREKGRVTGAQVKNKLATQMVEHEALVRQLFPNIPDLDLRAAWRDCDRERLAAEPDYTKFPETRGLIDRHLGEREGFREAAGCDETATAFHFSADWFWQKRLNSRYVARWDLLTTGADGCTNIFIPEGVDGVTIGDNRDIPLPRDRFRFRDYWPSHLRLDGQEVSWIQGSVSSGILLDEEPGDIFPLSPHELMPRECREDIKAIVEFMTRYADFWGPCKQLWVDRKLRAVGVEKSNRRLGILPADPKTGAVAITACSAITPEIQPLRDRCFRRAAEIKGETLDQNLDWQYVHGGDQRQQRLTELTFAEARRGATIWGALGVVADRAVPYPARVCLAGEKTFPDREPLANWSVTQHAAVLTGPRRRVLYRNIEDTANPKPVSEYTPTLRLGADIPMQPEWEADVKNGRCRFVSDQK